MDTPPAAQQRPSVWSGRLRARTVWGDRLWLVFGGVWLSIGALTALFHEQIPLFFLLSTVLLMPLAAGSCIIFRMGPLVAWISSLELRQELALTMIEPRTFIFARFRRRLFNLLLPFLILGPVSIIALILVADQVSIISPPDASVVALLPTYWLISALVPLLAVADSMVRLCRSPGGSGRRFGIEAVWVIFLISIPVAQYPASVAFFSSPGLRWLGPRLLVALTVWGGTAVAGWRLAGALVQAGDPEDDVVRHLITPIKGFGLRVGAILLMGFIVVPISMPFIGSFRGNYDYWMGDNGGEDLGVNLFWGAYAYTLYRLIRRRIKQAVAGYFMFEAEPTKSSEPPQQGQRGS